MTCMNVLLNAALPACVDVVVRAVCGRLGYAVGAAVMLPLQHSCA
jgi:hypothetical protein